MEPQIKTKRYTFRLSDRTIDKLNGMIEAGHARNRTDAIELSVDMYFDTEERLAVIENQIQELQKKVETNEQCKCETCDEG